MPSLIKCSSNVSHNQWEPFLDALASLDFKLSVGESVSNLPFFKYSVNQVVQVTQLIQDNHDNQVRLAHL